MLLLCSAFIKTDHILHHMLSIPKVIFSLMIIFPYTKSHLHIAKEEWAGGIYSTLRNMDMMSTYTREEFQLGQLSTGHNYWKYTFGSVRGGYSMGEG